MAEALYRKYRSRSLDDVVGQDHITKTLSNAITAGKISHAYLFSGPRGVGKTSVARILAHQINGFDYSNDDDNFLDIIEFDAASNRGIEKISEIIDLVNLSPSNGKYKVFIIDEVHMLTTFAFNALLKTLEEPPEYVVFILATTESHKVPETILSRTQHFTFRAINLNQVADRLKYIAKQEKIAIYDDAIDYIAQYGSGSFRDSIGLLDQASNLGTKITLKDLEFIIGAAPAEIVNSISATLFNGSIIELNTLINKISKNGYSVESIVKQLILSLKQSLINDSSSVAKLEVTDLISELLKISQSSDKLTQLEVVLYSYILKRESANDKESPKVVNLSTPSNQEIITKPQLKVKIIKTPVEPIIEDNESVVGDPWDKLTQRIRTKYSTLYSIIKLSVPEFNNDQLMIKTKFPFHQKALTESKNRKLIADTLFDLTKINYRIEVVVDKSIKNIEEPSITDQDDNVDIKNISNIFGGVEVIE
jgi:DNA polymerase-3 subunit gamma/tau